jgi:hypothetical protein
MAKPSAQVLFRLFVLTLPGRHAFATTKMNLPLTLIFYSVPRDVNKKNVVFSLSKPCIFGLAPCVDYDGGGKSAGSDHLLRGESSGHLRIHS